MTLRFPLGSLVLAASLALPAAALAQATDTPAAATTAAQATAPTEAPPPRLSDTAAKVYGLARDRLVQVRTLLKGQSSQNSVGSGFLVSRDGLLITNYHVVSGAALQPSRFELIYTTLDGEEGALELLGFDVIHDLALLRVVGDGLRGVEPLALRSPDQPLQRGERIFSLGNPLDVGFAVMEGNYNGLVERAFYPNIFFGGSLSGGMSGGPTLDEQGRVIGVNVAARRDGEQISFLVPAEYARQLQQSHAGSPPLHGDIHPEITRQLLAHQQHMTDRFLALPWQPFQSAGYQVPVPQEAFMRCWGRSSPEESKGLRQRSTQCSMDTQIFISNRLYIQGIELSHRWMDGSHLGPWRFASRYSDRFGGQIHGAKTADPHSTPAQCHERFVTSGDLPMRAVLCMDAYKKLPGLYDMRLMLASVDQADQGVQSTFSAYGVSFANAMRLSEYFLAGFARQP